MCRIPSETQIFKLRQKYPPGTQIIVLDSEEEVAPETVGTIIKIDDYGEIIVRKENGKNEFTLNPSRDRFEVLTD